MKSRILILVLCFITAIVFAGSGSVTVYITKTGSKYHNDGCKYLSSTKISISLEDAVKKGYKPCSVCKPPILGK